MNQGDIQTTAVGGNFIMRRWLHNCELTLPDAGQTKNENDTWAALPLKGNYIIPRKKLF